MSHPRDYIPALGLAQLTPLYDAAMASIFREHRLRMPLVDALDVLPGQRVLDIGCGTATLSLLIEEHAPGGIVVGLDIDPLMLAVAQRKVAHAGGTVPLTWGSADTLPYADGSFHHVVSSLMLHHLATPQKLRMLDEAYRVLRPGGRILVLDFGPVGQRAVARGVAAVFGHFEQVGDNLYGRVPGLLAQAGFGDVQVRNVAFGGLVKLYVGSKTHRPTSTLTSSPAFTTTT